MIAHFSRMAFKAFYRFKMHTLISLVSLVFGFSCFIAAKLLSDYVDSFDRNFPNAANVYNIYQVAINEQSSFDNFPIVHEPAARYLRTAFPELRHVVRTSVSGNMDVTYEGQTDDFAIRAVEAEFLDIFPIPLLSGTADSSSLPPNSMLVTEDAAIRRFGTTDVIGNVVALSNKVDVAIVGVISRFDFPSHLDSAVPMFKTDMIVPIEVYDEIWETGSAIPASDPSMERWGNQSYFVYLEFEPGQSVDVNAFNQRLDEFVKTNIPSPYSDSMSYEIKPVNKLLISMLAIFTQGFSIISILQVAGALVLFIGCLNYSNLVIAQLSLRSQEIAVQKILGAKRSLLIVQYCFESLLFISIALGITLLLFFFILSSLGSSSGGGLGPGLLLNPSLWLVLLVVVAMIVAVAGLYPAMRTATVRLVTMMRPKGSGGYSGRLRAMMVGTQFFISGVLMILAIVMFRQNVTMTEQLDGDVADPKIVISVRLDTLDVDTQLLINELQQSPGVLSVTQVDRMPWELGMSTVSLSLDPDVNAVTTEFVDHDVSYEFAETLDIPPLAGRSFSRDRSSDLTPTSSDVTSRSGPFGLILDDIAARNLGFDSAEAAIGQTVYRHLDPPYAPREMVLEHTIIGTVGKQTFQFIDYNTFGVAGDVYTLQPANANYLIIKSSRESVAETLAHIDSTWNQLLPDTPIKRVFADELFYQTYQLFLAMSAAIGGLSIFGFLIASIGLLGNATFITNIRQKEVGIRKVMGASSKRLMAMLLFDFAKPVIIANAIAWPLGYFIAKAYISLFAVQTGISVLPFMISLLLSVFIAVLAVVSQSWKSARVRPAMTLRYE